MWVAKFGGGQKRAVALLLFVSCYQVKMSGTARIVSNTHDKVQLTILFFTLRVLIGMGMEGVQWVKWGGNGVGRGHYNGVGFDEETWAWDLMFGVGVLIALI